MDILMATMDHIERASTVRVWHSIERDGSILTPPVVAKLKEKLNDLIETGFSTAYIMLAFVQLMRDGKVRVDIGDECHRLELVQTEDCLGQTQAIEVYVDHFRGLPSARAHAA